LGVEVIKKKVKVKKSCRRGKMHLTKKGHKKIRTLEKKNTKTSTAFNVYQLHGSIQGEGPNKGSGATSSLQVEIGIPMH